MYIFLPTYLYGKVYFFYSSFKRFPRYIKPFDPREGKGQRDVIMSVFEVVFTAPIKNPLLAGGLTHYPAVRKTCGRSRKLDWVPALFSSAPCCRSDTLRCPVTKGNDQTAVYQRSVSVLRERLAVLGGRWESCAGPSLWQCYDPLITMKDWVGKRGRA